MIYESKTTDDGGFKYTMNAENREDEKIITDLWLDITKRRKEEVLEVMMNNRIIFSAAGDNKTYSQLEMTILGKQKEENPEKAI